MSVAFVKQVKAALLPLADATAIAFSQPLFSVLVAVVLAKEKVRWRRWTATPASA